jgi:hypothetical protein
MPCNTFVPGESTRERSDCLCVAEGSQQSRGRIHYASIITATGAVDTLSELLSLTRRFRCKCGEEYEGITGVLMNGKSKCQLTACQCRTEGGRSYCSADCEQAASQGVERGFCQCPHAGCTSAGKDFLQVDATGSCQPSRFFSRGAITISYSNLDDLTRQVLALAAALFSDERQQSRDRDGTPIRHPVRSESVPEQAKYRTA